MQHEAICDFPSKHFYDGRLKTALSVKTRGRGIVNLWPAQQLRGKDWPVVFCHVEGKEESTIFKSAQSNEQSKSNMEEVMKAVSYILGAIHYISTAITDKRATFLIAQLGSE